MVGAEDVARVAAAVLTGPVMPSGAVVRLMAGAVTNKAIAEAFGDILGGSVGYVEVTDDQWVSAASAFGVDAVRWNTSPTCGATCALARRISSLLSHQRRVRTLHHPATAVAAAIPATAQDLFAEAAPR